MSATVSFQPEVRDWIVHNLGRGVPAHSVVGELVDHDVQVELATAMVDAVSQAMTQGTPLPECARPVDPPREYRSEPLSLKAASQIQLGDRCVRVLARVQRPALALLANLLSTAECQQLIELARPRLRRSTQVDPVTGRDIIAGHRSSDAMSFRPREKPLIARIEQRIAELTGAPLENSEGLRLLHYPTGAQTTPHFDYLTSSSEANRESIARSGQCISTLIMYLNDVEEGGETIFPEVGWSIMPQRGHAIYFEYANHSGQCDPASLHAGAPVRSGEKWIATMWTRSRPFAQRGDMS